MRSREFEFTFHGYRLETVFDMGINDETDGSGMKAKETGDGSLFEIVKPGFSGGQAVLRLFYPARRSDILPETAEAKAKKPFLVQ